VKAFTATGGVITTAGVIFAVTMLAMLASPVYIIAQIGFTIGAGLLIDTFIVRTLTVPAVAALLGARIWWPNGLFRLQKAKGLTSSPGPSPTWRTPPHDGHAAAVSSAVTAGDGTRV
jgi:RND superfamily putative drug exporter